MQFQVTQVQAYIIFEKEKVKITKMFKKEHQIFP